MPHCPDCDETVDSGASYCPTCGSRLVDDGATGSTPRRAEDGADDSWDWGVAEPNDGWADAGANRSSDGRRVDDERYWTDDRPGSAADWTDDDRSDSSRAGETTTAAAYHEARTSRERHAADPDPTPARPSGPRFHDANVLAYGITFPLGKRGKPLLIDTAMWLVWFLVVPMLCSYGYSIRVGRAAARGDAEPPSFDDWSGLAKDGAVLIGLGIAGLVAFALWLATTGWVGSLVAGTPVSGVVDLVALLGTLVGLYLAGAIVPVLVGTGSLRETLVEFAFVEFALTRHYLLGIVVSIVFAVGSYVAFLLLVVVLALTVVGLVLVIPLLLVFPIYLTNALFAIWGHVYNRAAAAGTVEPVQADDSLGIT